MGVTSLNCARSKDGGDFGTPEFAESFWLHDERFAQATIRRSVRKKVWKDMILTVDGEGFCSISAVTWFHKVRPTIKLSRTRRRPCGEVQRQQISSSRRTLKERWPFVPRKS